MKKYIITTTNGEYLIQESNYISFINNNDVIDIQEIVQTKPINIENQGNTEMIEFFSRALNIPITNNSIIIDNGDVLRFEISEKWVSFSITSDINIVKHKVMLDLEICKKTFQPLLDYDFIDRETYNKLIKELEKQKEN